MTNNFPWERRAHADILPCPCCGSSDVYERIDERIYCNDCDTRALNRGIWNNRPAPEVEICELSKDIHWFEGYVDEWTKQKSPLEAEDFSAMYNIINAAKTYLKGKVNG